MIDSLGDFIPFLINIMEENSSVAKPVLVVLAVVVVIGVLSFVYWPFQKSTELQKPFYVQMLEKNKEFAHAEGLLKSGKYDEAASYFKLALDKAEGYKEEGQLKHKLAISKSLGSRPIEGIALLKEVIANENYTPMIRAYAVQQLAHLLSAYNTSEIRDEVYKDEPYKSFLAEGDYPLALRRLYEYSSSFYPLGVPELRIARWYSTEVLKLVQGGGSDEATKNNIEGMKSIIRQKLANADKYLLEISTDEQARSYTAEVLYRKGAVLGELYLAGDTSFGDPEATFKKALELSAIRAGQESAAKLRYAVFLAEMYGEERVDDIKKLLSDFYVGTKYASTNTVRSIKNEKDGTLGNRDDYLLLASMDAQFAQFLRTLGWVI